MSSLTLPMDGIIPCWDPGLITVERASSRVPDCGCSVTSCPALLPGAFSTLKLGTKINLDFSACSCHILFSLIGEKQYMSFQHLDAWSLFIQSSVCNLLEAGILHQTLPGPKSSPSLSQQPVFFPHVLPLSVKCLNHGFLCSPLPSRM